MVGDLTYKDEAAFKMLLALDTVRGPHSTGVCVVPMFNKGFKDISVVKEVGTPWELFGTPEWRSALTGFNKLFIGHNRWATKGLINRDNAHPFEHGKVIGAHNGTLKTQSLLMDSKLFDVDSDNIYHNINEEGIQETVSKLHGSFALTWYNKEDDTLNLCRNKERPLFFTYTKDSRALFWASEVWMLRVALAKEGLEHGEVYEVAELTHYCFDLTDLHKRGAPKAKVSKVAGYVPPKAQSNIFTGGGYYEDEVYGVYHPPRGHRKRGSHHGNTGNVVPITSIRASSDFRGKRVNFLVEGPDYPLKGNLRAHIKAYAYVDGKKGFAVKIFPPVNGEDWRALSVAGVRWSGVVKKISTTMGGYGLIDVRTIQRVDKEVVSNIGNRVLTVVKKTPDTETCVGSALKDAVDTKLYNVGSGGHKVSLTLYNKKVAQGCCVCSDAALPIDHDRIIWILGDEEYVCHSCQDTDIAKTYMEV